MGLMPSGRRPQSAHNCGRVRRRLGAAVLVAHQARGVGERLRRCPVAAPRTGWPAHGLECDSRAGRCRAAGGGTGECDLGDLASERDRQ